MQIRAHTRPCRGAVDGDVLIPPQFQVLARGCDCDPVAYLRTAGIEQFWRDGAQLFLGTSSKGCEQLAIKLLVGDKVAQATRGNNAYAQVSRAGLDGLMQRESQAIAARGCRLVRWEIGIDEDGNHWDWPLSHELGHDGSVGVSEANRILGRGNLFHSCHTETLID